MKPKVGPPLQQPSKVQKKPARPDDAEDDVVTNCCEPMMKACPIPGGCLQHRCWWKVCSNGHAENNRVFEPPAFGPDSDEELAPNEVPQYVSASDNASSDIEFAAAAPLAEPPGARKRRESELKHAADVQVVSDHATEAKRSLQQHHIAADGHCLFRAIAFQTPEGEANHRELRQQVVTEVQRHPKLYE